MQVLILHSRYRSGSASGENRVVEDEARLLREGGHDARVFAPEPERLSGAGLVGTGLGAIWSRPASRAVRAILRAHRSEVVHVHNLFPALSPAAIRAAAEVAPVLMTLHNYRLMCLPATFLRDGEPCELCLGRIPWRGVRFRCYRDSAPASAALASSLTLHRAAGTFDRVALYLAVSGFVRDKHIEAGFPRERIRVKPNFAWPTAPRDGPGEYFLYVGRLSGEKGVDTLLEVWRGRRERLIVVGDGPAAAELRSTAPAGVEFRGGVDPSAIGPLLSRARALLVPSRSYEGGPRGIVEAFAAGVPVVASRIGALPDLVEEGVTGHLIDPHDVTAWGRAVDRLLYDGEAERLGGGALAAWGARYAPEQALRDLLASYREAQRRGGGPRDELANS